MEQEHLHLLINEEIYQLPEDEKSSEALEVATDQTETEVEEPVSEIVDPGPEIVKEPEGELEPVQEVETEQKKEDQAVQTETKQESPEIPVQEVVESQEIPFAVFHSSSNQSDQELLQKIIDACKLPEDQYRIFANGFDQSVLFKKALVFVPEAKAFYTPIPYKNSEFLCSKPLEHISGDVQEKAKLWNALQKFV